MKVMSLKLSEGRKSGSGHHSIKRERNKLGVYKIYGLCDPTTDEVMYVGCTKNYLCKRLQMHLNCVRRLKQISKRDIWIKGLLDRGLKPYIKELENLKGLNKEEARMKENEYIEKYGKLNSQINYKKLNRDPNKDEVLIRDKKQKEMYIRKKVNNKYSKELKEKICELYSKGTSVPQIIKDLNLDVSKEHIRYILYRNSESKKYKKEREIKDIEFIMMKMKVYDAGIIAKLLNMDRRAVAYRIKQINEPK